MQILTMDGLRFPYRPLPSLTLGVLFPQTDSSIIVLAPDFYNKMMKARVYVSLKPTVLDPQGQTICSALHGLGYHEIAAVRQGKYFEIAIAEEAARDATAKKLDEAARDVLSNPVIEEYRVEILD
ncbi:MAG: phosphoribosylformylglycinamidine synthase subunit PurS [Bryobacteraceae bacterium]